MAIIRVIAGIAALAILAQTTTAVRAEWTGPAEMASTKRGSGSGEIGMPKSDSDADATIESVPADGSVLVADPVNRKVIVYGADGKLLREERRAPGAPPAQQSEFKKGSATPAAGRITLSIAGKDVVLESERDFDRYARDRNGYLYGIGKDMVRRFDRNGKKAAEVSLPRPHEDLLPESDPNRPQRMPLYVQYSDPVVGPGGDLFLLKLSDRGVTVLRWSWSDGGPR